MDKGVLLSVVVPAYNEAGGLASFNIQLVKILRGVTDNSYEIIYVNDGSTDDSAELIKGFVAKDKSVKLVSFSRNFGKEIATTAGINQAGGQAIIMLDADGQHPLALIPEFIDKWRAGAKVVIGHRVVNRNEGLIKRFGSKLFYKWFNSFSGMKIVPGSSDFRLIDRSVQQEFSRITERGRMTRVLIDWLGYDREYIDFKANPRTSGEAGYSFTKLFKLAIDSIISMTKSPLYISAYIGAVVLPISVLIGLFMIIESVIGDPLNLRITGSAYVVVLLLFLVGILLISQGIIGLYLSHIHTETQNRPLYIIDKQKSVGINEGQT